jgi:alkylation response protein AidB-like acyl-CoA dehydrogenase
MDFSLNEEQQMLSTSVADFTTKESTVDRARRLRDDPVGWEKQMWSQIADLGWLMVPFPEEVGGLGWSFSEVALIVEQLGRTLVPEPYVPSLLAGYAVHLSGGPESVLERLFGGEISMALALTEPARRHSPLPAHVRAEAGWTLTGTKVWVDNGHAADLIVVSAVTADGPTLFLVEGAAVQREPRGRIDGRKSAHLTFAETPAELLGSSGGAADILGRLVDIGAGLAVCEGVGVCQRMLELTLEHLKVREQFGVPIGSFQALQHRAVDMFAEVELLRSIAMEVSVRMDTDGADRRRAVSAAKAQLSTGGKYVARQAIQLHGGIGCTDEHDVGLFFKRLHALDAAFGGADFHVSRYADEPGFLDT